MIFNLVTPLLLLLESIAERLGIGNASSVQLRSGKDGIVGELGSLLSTEAIITLPSSPRWSELVVRAAAPRIHPDFVAVVEVATEKDVQRTVGRPHPLTDWRIYAHGSLD
jgi:hypothetical protein